MVRHSSRPPKMYDSEMKNPPKIKNNKLPSTFPVEVRADVAFIMIGVSLILLRDFKELEIKRV